MDYKEYGAYSEEEAKGQVELCEIFISDYMHRNKKAASLGSGGLKHVIEAQYNTYISATAVVRACRTRGIPVSEDYYVGLHYLPFAKKKFTEIKRNKEEYPQFKRAHERLKDVIGE